MAPVPFIHPVRYPPLVLAAAHLVALVWSAYAVGASLYTSYKLLGPISGTRSRIHLRQRFTPVFLGLAVVSLVVAIYCSAKSLTLSYNTWAYEHGLDMTQSRFLAEHESHLLDEKHSSRQLYIAQWLSDTPIYTDSFEIVAEASRRFWWGQQINSGITAFSLILATKGRRQKIPLLTAFLALAHLVNLSFAQNLFFLALLLTPSPLPEGDQDLLVPAVPLFSSAWTRLRKNLIQQKPTGWVPNVNFFYGAIVVNAVLTFFLPYAAGTSTFSKVAFLARASSFLPVILPKIIPVHWGEIQQHPHGAYESLTKLFRFFSTVTFVWHVKSSLVALLSNLPNSHYHRHSALFPWDIEERSRWDRSTSALGKIIGSISEHPVVAGVGWDALLCALSLGIWAAVRNIDASDMMSSSVPFYNSNLSSFKWTSPDKGSVRNNVLNFLESSDVVTNQEQEHKRELEHEHEHGMKLRARSRLGSATSSSGTNEELQKLPTPSKQRRGRPRKTQPTHTPELDSEDKPHGPVKNSRSRKGENNEDDTYVPTPATARSALEGDELPPHDLDWESASLAWGLATFGGLASASAGVFGGECISR
ncbi:hypothetical protein F4678DRAFT_440399 [Xylaria arbuscula]|nr:hypothetical protein F4678DRAFT_440399 [Xylaria arbuscula]